MHYTTQGADSGGSWRPLPLRQRWFRTLLWLATISLVCAPAAAQRRQQFVSANFADKVDSKGFRWDVGRYGYIGNGTNNCFSNACQLSINNNSFSAPQSSMMTADGNEYVLTRQESGLQVTRRVKVDLKAAAVRYVEMFHNPAAGAVTAQVRLRTSLGRTQGQAMVSSSGQPAGAVLGEKDTGVILIGQPNVQQLSVVFFLAGPRSKVKPTIQNQSNYQVSFNYVLNIPAGKTVSILHGIAQRQVLTLPTAKVAEDLFKPFHARNWTRDLPRDLRDTIANLGTAGFGGFDDAGSLLTLESLEVDRQAADVLAVGEQTRLNGTATCKQFAVETAYGPLTLPFDKVAAIAGERCTGRQPRVFLADGQVLNGPITADGLQFTMNSGLPLELDLQSLDRLVMRAGPEDGQAADGVVAMLETTDGDRLALLPADEQSVAASTPWGDRQVPLEEIDRIFLSEQKVGHHLVLRDGSRLFGFVSTPVLALKTLYFGEQEFAPAKIRRLTAAHLQSAEDDPDLEIAAPHLLLAGENVLVGQVDLAALHFVTAGQTIPVPPNQIRVLRNVSSEADDTASGRPLFEAELWDGGTVRGELAELVLPLRCADLLAHVPVLDVVEARVPTPVVTDTMRGKIARLIRDLGHPEYPLRKAAKEALAELGHLPKLQLDEALRQTSDPEVRRSVEALLEDLRK
ncbi:MAG: hypothetical protein JXB62_13020 [Pirellulales bacterium]|nr:hypothetical protein [Pirellulales bacterium]